MKLHCSTNVLVQLASAAAPHGRHGKSGFAVLGVFVLLTLMVVFVMSNTAVLNQLHREIRLIERRHLEKFESAPVQSTSQTNATAATLVIRAK